MTHFPSKRLPRPGAVLAAVVGPAASLCPGAVGDAKAAAGPTAVGDAKAAAGPTAIGGTMAAAGPKAADGAPAAVASAATAARWTDRAHGFASLAGATTAGAGGKVVSVVDQASPARYAAAEEPYVIRVKGAVAAEPFGSDTVVTSNKTIVGVGDTGEIVHGELHLNPGTHNVIIRNPTIRDSCVEGDVDFVHGRAATVIDRSVIRLLRRGSATDNGYLTAASTWTGNPYGFLITRPGVVDDAPADAFRLGRPWRPGGEPAAVAQVLIRDTEPPAAVKSAPWTDMSGFSWRDARFAEYRNHGPGATGSADRPQLSDADARMYTVAIHLKGTDGRAPSAPTGATR
ncbi:pectinesterase family protein [Streptomyces sp. NPDC050263]|uniref:pectinesterase family protein n=1 Tax=Streptomyces sp. NPDC050263 TaxID=3155037 RepID=UPI003423037E